MVRVLIADDDLIITKQLFNDIINRNDNIQLVGINSNGIEVLEYLEKQVPDILILDLMMPKMNGLELLDKLISNKSIYFPKLHIIVVSGYIDKLYKKPIYIDNIYAKIEKPYDVLQLVKVIKNVSHDIENENIKEYVNYILSKFEFNIKSNAYIYFKEAISEVLYRREQNFELENDIYVKIAKIHKKKNPKVIKWTIEKLIYRMYINTKYDIIQDYFRLSRR